MAEDDRRCVRKVSASWNLTGGWVFTFAAAAYNLVRLRNLAMQMNVSQRQAVPVGLERDLQGAAAATPTLLSHKNRETWTAFLSRAVVFPQPAREK